MPPHPFSLDLDLFDLTQVLSTQYQSWMSLMKHAFAAHDKVVINMSVVGLS